ncbi:hypothetical protein PRZ48_007415 [Zasmidium cellare]|uniref:Uncharacterized protein n=1 Tax=Zasmidium cellare TaxID=395010 RepID=A0ABR0EKC8_ZASCE|nr:hypothetical protein PRZ48_007415 [Zasmidium cellare]
MAFPKIHDRYTCTACALYDSDSAAEDEEEHIERAPDHIIYFCPACKKTSCTSETLSGHFDDEDSKKRCQKYRWINIFAIEASPEMKMLKTTDASAPGMMLHRQVVTAADYLEQKREELLRLNPKLRERTKKESGQESILGADLKRSTADKGTQVRPEDLSPAPKTNRQKMPPPPIPQRRREPVITRPFSTVRAAASSNISPHGPFTPAANPTNINIGTVYQSQARGSVQQPVQQGFDTESPAQWYERMQLELAGVEAWRPGHPTGDFAGPEDVIAGLDFLLNQMPSSGSLTEVYFKAQQPESSWFKRIIQQESQTLGLGKEDVEQFKETCDYTRKRPQVEAVILALFDKGEEAEGGFSSDEADDELSSSSEGETEFEDKDEDDADNEMLVVSEDENEDTSDASDEDVECEGR